MVAASTQLKYEKHFRHWRIFRHNRYGTETSPWILNRFSIESEDQSLEFVCYLFSIGNSFSTATSKLAGLESAELRRLEGAELRRPCGLDSGSWRK